MTIYLDNAATSFPKPESVYQALDRFARTRPGQPRPGRAQDGPRRRARPRRRPASAQPVLPRRRSRSASSSRSTAPTPSTWPSRACWTTAITSSRPTWNTTASAGRCGRWSWPADHPDAHCTADGGGTVDPDDDPQGHHAEDAAHRPDARQQRARHRAADRRDRPDRPRARPALPRRCGPDGRRRADRRAGDAHRPAGVPRPQVAVGADRHRGTCTSARARKVRRLARGRHRRRFVQRDAAARVPLLPRRRHAQRARRRRPGRRHSATCRNRAWSAIHGHEVELVERLWRRLDEIGGYRGVRPSRPCAGASARSASAARRCRRRSWAASSIRRSTSPSGPACTALRTSIGRIGTFPDGTVRVSPGPFNTPRTSITWPTHSAQILSV